MPNDAARSELERRPLRRSKSKSSKASLGTSLGTCGADAGARGSGGKKTQSYAPGWIMCPSVRLCTVGDLVGDKDLHDVRGNLRAVVFGVSGKFVAVWINLNPTPAGVTKVDVKRFFVSGSGADSSVEDIDAKEVTDDGETGTASSKETAENAASIASSGCGADGGGGLTTSGGGGGA